MRRFLYFLPGQSGANPRTLANLGLLGRFTGAADALIEHSITGCDAGPGGSTGCIVAAGQHPAGYEPDKQRWIEGKGFWVGVEDFLPRPQDLERELGIAGHQTALADDLLWRVPLVRRWNRDTLQHTCALPKTLAPTRGADGKMRMESKVAARFASIDEMADRLFLAFVAQDTMPLDEVCRDAAELLSTNYRIGLEEAGLLGLFDEQSAVRVLALSIDYAALAHHAAELATEGLQASEITIREEDC